MTHQIRLLVLIFILISSNSILAQGFNSISTPDGVNVIAVGDSGKIFRSYNSGNSWASYTMSTVNFKNVFSYNNNVWIAGDNGKIYRTLKTNSPVNAYDVGTSNSINSLCFLDDNNGFLCGDGGIVYKTINGGLNWVSGNSGIASIKLNSISFIDQNNGIVVGENGNAYITSNSGLSWTLESVGTTKNLLKVKYFIDGITITGEYGTLILKSNTSNWTSVETRILTDVNSVTGSSMNDVHVCGGGGFIRNNRSGDTRFYSFEANPMIANLVDIFYYDANLGFAVSSLNTAIIRTTNGGTWTLTGGTSMSYQWEQKLTGVPSSSGGNSLCKHPNDRNSVFVAYKNNVYVSRNRGEDWSFISNIPVDGKTHSFYVSPIDTNVWMAAISAIPEDKVMRSTDYGHYWNAVFSANFTDYGMPLEMDQNNPGNYYFTPDNGGFFRSTNNGVSFTEISNNFPFVSPCDLLVMWDSSNVIFAGDARSSSTGRAIIYKSANGGVNWTNVRTLTSSEVPSLNNSVFQQNNVYANEWAGSNFYKSQDYGNTWNVLYSTGSSGWSSGVCYEDPNVILIGSYSSQSQFAFTYNGEDFTLIDGPIYANAGILMQDKNFILSMQKGSLYKLKVDYSVLTTVNENILSSIIPKDFALSQNYPNPFNPTTNIKFGLLKSENVSLIVYDQLGREVEILSDGFKNAGSYEINFHANNLSSGIYFYKLVSNSVSITKKMLLLK